MKKIFLFLSVFLATTLMAQNYSRIEKRANNYYENEEYSMALPLYDSLLNQFPENTFYLTRMGDCYFHTGKTEKAIKKYHKAYNADGKYADAVFKLGSAYDRLGKADSAIYFFKDYLKIRPEDPNGYNRLAIVYMSKPGYEDSAVNVSERGIKTEPKNPRPYYINAMAYLNKSRPVDAIFAAREGLKHDSSYSMLYMPLGIGHLRRGNYKEANEFLEKGMSLSDDKGIFVEYASFSRVLRNTDKKQIKQADNNKIYFSKINTRDIEKLIKEVRNEKSDYYYPDMLRKFNDNTLSFSLDEFFMLYIGYTTDKNYKPYFPENEELIQLWEDKMYIEYLDKGEKYLLEHPVSFHIYLKMATIADYLDLSEEHYKYSFQYQGFLNAVMASGSGRSTKDAMIICYPWHENTVMSEMGLEVLEQTMLKEKDQVFEHVTGRDVGGYKKDVFFNITIAYRALEKALKQDKGK